MRIPSLLAALALALPFAACAAPDYGRALPPGAPALLPLKHDERRPDFSEGFANRDEIVPALDRSIEWFKKESSKQHFPIEQITHARAQASVIRFRQLLFEARDAGDFTRRLNHEFQVYKSAGWNAKGGGVLFTAYCTPIFDGSRTPDATYRFPLYGLPPDLAKAKDGAILGRRAADGSISGPYPTRREIEASAMLEGKGLELVYLKDPLDAFIAHVNGSAFIKTPNGEELKFGYSGKNGREYSSLGKELIRAKELKSKDMSLEGIRKWGRNNPDKLSEYMSRNDSYVFFLEIDGNPRGSLNLEVEGNRTIATDKALFPRGGLVFVEAPPAAKKWRWPWESKPRADPAFHQFMLDQDTGGAIRTAGRADLYLGVGPDAERRAGHVMSEGQMYYLFLREDQLLDVAP